MPFNNHSTRPFESISDNYFTVARKNFQVVVDCLSGWPVVVCCGTDTLAAMTICHFWSLFCYLGVPLCLRMDNGTYFMSQEVAGFFRCWGVCHKVSPPH